MVGHIINRVNRWGRFRKNSWILRIEGLETKPFLSLKRKDLPFFVRGGNLIMHGYQLCSDHFSCFCHRVLELKVFDISTDTDRLTRNVFSRFRAEEDRHFCNISCADHALHGYIVQYSIPHFFIRHSLTLCPVSYTHLTLPTICSV